MAGSVKIAASIFGPAQKSKIKKYPPNRSESRKVFLTLSHRIVQRRWFWTPKYANVRDKAMFKDEVFKTVKNIPMGKTMSYKDVAAKAGSPRAWRAVGSILNKNYNSEIPCHRVIKTSGEPGGYNKGAEEKSNLLKREGCLK